MSVGMSVNCHVCRDECEMKCVGRGVSCNICGGGGELSCLWVRV